MTVVSPDDLDVVIVGAGLSGLCAGIKLKRAGIGSFIILEKANSVGGTWRENTYPGVACDVPSHLYSYSFAPNPDWSRAYAPGGEIHQYMRSCARQFDLEPHMQYGARVRELRFVDDRWLVTLESGKELRGRFVIAAMGGLHVPNIPPALGADRFKGKCFHTARWDHSGRLDGQQIAIVGTGASAVQCAPEVAKIARKLTVYQRSPTWILPKKDPVYSASEIETFRSSDIAMRLHRLRIWFEFERFGNRIGRDNAFNRKMRAIGTSTIRRQVKDPELAEKLIPDYDFGCKRPTVSNDYFPMFNRPNVELETSPIQAIEESGIRTSDGRFRPLDALILATGFKAFDITSEVSIVGRDGRDLKSAWKQRVAAHRSTMVPGFPNFLIMLGPNSAGLTSALLMIEAQADYAVQIIRQVARGEMRYVQPKPSAMQAYNGRLQSALSSKLLNRGCASWWTDGNGYNHTSWPHSSLRYRLEMLRPSWREFDISYPDPACREDGLRR